MDSALRTERSLPSRPQAADAPTPGLRAIWYRDLALIESLEPAWRALEERVKERTVHGRFDWMAPWMRHMCPLYGAPLVAAVWQAQELLAIAPLTLWRGTLGRVTVRRLDLAGHNCEQGEVLLAPDRPDVLAELLRALLSERQLDVVVLNGVVPGSAQESAILDAACARKLAVERLPYAYAVVDFAAGYPGYLARMSSNFRRNLRRHADRMARAGTVSIDRIRGFAAPERIRPFMDRIQDISSRSWKAKAQGPPNPAHHQFFSEVAERFGARGMLDLAILQVGDRDAAFILGLREGDRWYDGSISYADEFADLSPGTYLMHRMLERLAEEGVRLVVSHGDHQYKLRWTNQFVRNDRLFLFSSGLGSRLARLARFQMPRLFPRMRPQTDSVVGTAV